MHIEQGPVLEQKAKRIGIVTGVQNMSRHEVIVEGQEAHAGPTPMDMRRDPIRVLADLLSGRCMPRPSSAVAMLGLRSGASRRSPVRPIPYLGRLRFTVDVRHPDAQQYAAFKAELNRWSARLSAGTGWPATSAACGKRRGSPSIRLCVAAVREATAALGFCVPGKWSAGRATIPAMCRRVAPTAMIFVPCAGGLSHNEAESAQPVDLAAGADVLLHAMLALAKS